MFLLENIYQSKYLVIGLLDMVTGILISALISIAVLVLMYSAYSYQATLVEFNIGMLVLLIVLILSTPIILLKLLLTKKTAKRSGYYYTDEPLLTPFAFNLPMIIVTAVSWLAFTIIFYPLVSLIVKA
jgi:uncharacterized membrane protein